VCDRDRWIARKLKKEVARAHQCESAGESTGKSVAERKNTVEKERTETE